MRRLVLLSSVASALLAAACSDGGPVSAPGTLTATLHGPNPAEGAAVVSLLGDGIGAVTPAGGTDLRSRAEGDEVRLVLIHPTGGVLSFRVQVADTTAPPAWVVEEVAGPDDELRADPGAYTVSFSSSEAGR